MAERIFRRVKRRRPAFTEQDLLLTVRILSRHHFQTVEDVLAFLSKLRKQETSGEVAALLEKPATDEERAEMLVIRSLMSQSKQMKKRYANDALELNPNSVSALNALGDASEAPEAMAAYRKAADILYQPLKHLFPITTERLETAPREVYLWFKIMFTLALIARVSEQYDVGIEVVKKLLSCNPSDDTGARSELIVAFILKGSFREARVVLESLEKQDAVTLMFEAFLGYLLYDDIDEAFRHFDEAMIVNPLLASRMVGEYSESPQFDDNNINLEDQADYIIEIIKQVFYRYPKMEEAFANAIFSIQETPDEE